MSTEKHRCPCCYGLANIITFGEWNNNQERTADCHCSRCGKDWQDIEKKTKAQEKVTHR